MSALLLAYAALLAEVAKTDYALARSLAQDFVDAMLARRYGR